jgi:AraC family transcriptional regulator of adaptative response/methylated-DNA-[protein]-cysteine methyltransferase
MVTDTSIHYSRIAQAIGYLQENFTQQPELDEIAEKVHLSPFHFQRLFSEWAGISPKRFLQFLTVDYLKKKLTESQNLQEAAEQAGLSGQSRVYDLFTTLEAVTPLEYKCSGNGLTITYGFHETPFGRCLLGTTSRGICWFSFLQTEETDAHAIQALKSHWYNSHTVLDANVTARVAEKVFDHPRQKKDKFHLLVKGTNFQVKVWEALLKLPLGNVATYQSIASSIHNPRALQAVGSAVGANHIAYLIPCHRVIRKDGQLGEYRWNATRKKSIIGWEMAKTTVDNV